jgi:DNA-binding transcriptional regulator YhcF (GntR family)
MLVVWQDLFHIDRRSQLSPAHQFKKQFINLLKDDVFQVGEILPSPDQLGGILTIDVHEMDKVYEELKNDQFLAKINQNWVVLHTTLSAYQLPRPFARRQQADAKPLLEKILKAEYGMMPLAIVNQFPHLDKVQVYEVQKAYFIDHLCVATSQTFYIPFDQKKLINEHEYEARILPSDRYVRDIQIVKPSLSLKKIFTQKPPMVLKGSYQFIRGQTQILEIGEVYTTLIYTYQLQSQRQKESFPY